jgi:hypothetical protein
VILGTLLQKVYDKFIIKASDEDFTYKQDLVFEFFETAIGYSYKTTPHDLGYTLYTDNSVLVIFSVLETSGDITLTINSDIYTIALLTTDTTLGIANKIKTAIEADWTVIIENGTYPVLTITKSGVSDIVTTFVDTDSTNISLSVFCTYDGIMDEDLDIDEIELISLNMKKVYLEYLLKPLSRLETTIGTKDFNRLPNKVEEYKIYSLMLKDLDEEIKDFRQEFYSYANT